MRVEGVEEVGGERGLDYLNMCIIWFGWMATLFLSVHIYSYTACQLAGPSQGEFLGVEDSSIR